MRKTITNVQYSISVHIKNKTIGELLKKEETTMTSIKK